MTSRPGLAAVALLATVLAASGCGAGRTVAHPGAATPAPAPLVVPTTAGTAALIEAAALSPCPVSTGDARDLPGRGVPDVALPCLAGHRPVRLTRLGRPAVVNLWASWCQPCAKELPVLAAVATATQGRVVFVGVDTADAPDRALRALTEAGVHYPSIYDRRSQVAKTLGLPGLPATVFLHADGTVAYTKLGPLSGAGELRSLMGTHLGIAA